MQEQTPSFLRKENPISYQERSPRRQEEEMKAIIYDKIDFEALQRDLKSSLFKDGRFLDEKTIFSFAQLIIDLAPHLEKYELILSDDSSGRLISLLLKIIIDSKRKQKGEPKSKIFFIQGGKQKEEVRQATNAFMREHIPKNSRILLATEHIESGKTILPLIDNLAGLGVNYDVATVSFEENPTQTSKYDKKLVSRAYYGTVGRAGVWLHEQEEFNGVVKQTNISSNYLAHPQKSAIANINDMRVVREDLKRIAEELLKLA